MDYDSNTYRLTNAHKYRKSALLLIFISGALFLAGLFKDPEQFFHSYLTAFVYWWSLGIAALFFTMLHHLTNATWSIVLRRIAETLAAIFPYLAAMAVPIFFGMDYLYDWSTWSAEVLETDHVLQQKAAYLNDTFFIIRTVVYFAIWILLSLGLYRTSISQDSGHTGAILKRMRKLSAAGMILFAVTISFAAFDWLMSLDAHWYSTIFGVYVFAGSLLNVLALMVVVARFLHSRGALVGIITIEHFHDVGRLMFAFTIFWAYIAFSQYFLIWYANIPEETVWFLHRWEGSWKVVSMLILFGHCIVPFLALMPRWTKRNLTALWIIAVWLLVMHWVDIYWLVGPNLHPESARLSWMDLAAWLSLGAIFLSIFWKKLSSQPLVPVGDPRLQASIEIRHD